MKVIIIYSLLNLTALMVIGQKTLTKKEIYTYWNTSRENKTIEKDSISLAANDKIDIKIHYLLDSLRKSNVDSLIVYSISYPGYIGMSDCVTGYYPISSFIIWKRMGLLGLLQLEGECQYKPAQLKSDSIFAFYDTNCQQLKEDIFMPIIYGGQNIGGNTKIAMSFTDHEPKYSFYYEINQFYKIFHFTESDLEDKKSLFHKDNLALKAYHWWRIVERQVAK